MKTLHCNSILHNNTNAKSIKYKLAVKSDNFLSVYRIGKIRYLNSSILKNLLKYVHLTTTKNKSFFNLVNTISEHHQNKKIPLLSKLFSINGNFLKNTTLSTYT